MPLYTDSMKFRYRGGATGFASRRIGRGIARSVPDDQLGSCFVIAFLLVLITGSPILLIIVLGILLSIVPVIFVLAFLVLVGMIIHYGIKKGYPQMIVSWFFLNEDEPDGTVLSFGEIKNRLKEFWNSD